MGLVRKSLSVVTVGAVGYRTPNEKTQRELRKANRLAAEQLAAQRAMTAQQAQLLAMQQQMAQQPPVMPVQQPQQWAPQQAPTWPQQPAQLPVAGWYVDQHNPAQLRWWDGAQWGSSTQPRSR